MEVLVVIAVVIFLVGFLLPGLVAAKQKARRIACVNNLKEIGVGFRLWEGDHGDKYPMAVSMTNGAAMEWIEAGKAYVLWQTMSNERRSPKILHCPADADHVAATNFSIDFSDANISYFVSLDADETYPQMILDGDDNLLVDGKSVQPGILNFRTGTTIAWTQDRHRGVGNIGMADGSAQQVTSEGFQRASSEAPNSTPAPGSVTIRWLIP
ncbi:MAG: type II secretion system protein [Limisphaerales bacterium]